MLSDVQIRDLWKRAMPIPGWEEWQARYTKFLERVQKMSDEELSRPENQKLIWTADDITPLGPGGTVKVDGAFTDPEVVNAIVALRRRVWPEDPSERADAMQTEGERLLALVCPRHGPRRPQARLWRLFAALLPGDFHCVFNYQAHQHVMHLLLGEKKYPSHVLIRARLRTVLGVEKENDFAEHVRRAVFCWWLHERYESIQENGVEAQVGVPTPPTAVDRPLPPLALWSYNKQFKGTFAIKRMVEAFRDTIRISLPGVARADVIAALAEDEGFQQLSLNSRSQLVSRLLAFEFLKQEDGLIRPTSAGLELLENDIPDVLVARMLERVFPFAGLLRFIKTHPRARTNDIVKHLQSLYPNWTESMGATALLSWARALDLVERVEDKEHVLSEYGAAWEARLPKELPCRPEKEGSELTSEAEEAEPLLSVTALPAGKPPPDLAAMRTLFQEDEEAKRFVFGDDQLAALHLAWHCQPHKRFVILSGLSGTGKTAIVSLYARLYCKAMELDARSHLAMVPVSPDWRDPSGLLGYYNALHEMPTFQVEPTLKLLLEAARNPLLPYFLILDEMNLARVEQYFAPFLSSMESGQDLLLHSEPKPVNGVPGKLPWPKNLFIAGTVNMDETTHPFSDKVLDRAFTMEFWDVDLKSFFARSDKRDGETEEIITDFHRPLQTIRRHFGYRTASEILSFVAAASELSADERAVLLDQAIFSKILPRLRGEETPDLREALEKLQEVSKKRDLKRCATKLEQMLGTLRRHGVVRFWS